MAEHPGTEFFRSLKNRALPESDRSLRLTMKPE